MSISPGLAERIYQYLVDEQHSLEEFKEKFCPGLSEYKDLVLIAIEEKRGYKIAELIPKKEYDTIKRHFEKTDEFEITYPTNRWPWEAVTDLAFCDVISNPCSIWEYTRNYDYIDSRETYSGHGFIEDAIKENTK